MTENTTGQYVDARVDFTKEQVSQAEELAQRILNHGNTPIKDLLGQTMRRVTADDDSMKFEFEDGRTYEFYHSQDCCENVSINDITGDLRDLEGEPILVAYEAVSDNYDNTPPQGDFFPGMTVDEIAEALNVKNPDSYTWTFYHFSTRKGSVAVRWLGESNGYYSESVTHDFVRTW